jgi:plasmid stabilization system protein ParE
MGLKKITWSKRAAMQFNNAITYIRSQSDQNADKVKLTVLTNIEKLSDGIHEHRQDPLKKNNDGHHRYFELLKLRISYYLKPDEIIITRIRHTKQEPKEY